MTGLEHTHFAVATVYFIIDSVFSYVTRPRRFGRSLGVGSSQGHDHTRKSEYAELKASLFLLARAAAAAPGSREPSRAASRPCGFDPSGKDYGAPRREHSGKGPAVIEHAGVAITAPVPGALLTGLVAALGPACRLWRRYAHAPAGAISS